jgi:hypothetical protein
LTFPGAYEDHPWEEDVVKVNKKVFVFLGIGDDPTRLAMTVKLDDSQEQALMVPGAEPTGYGLGRAGWVTAALTPARAPLAGHPSKESNGRRPTSEGGERCSRLLRTRPSSRWTIRTGH